MKISLFLERTSKKEKLIVCTLIQDSSAADCKEDGQGNTFKSLQTDHGPEKGGKLMMVTAEGLVKYGAECQCSVY